MIKHRPGQALPRPTSTVKTLLHVASLAADEVVLLPPSHHHLIIIIIIIIAFVSKIKKKKTIHSKQYQSYLFVIPNNQ